MALDDLARRTTRKLHHHGTYSRHKQRKKERTFPVSLCYRPKSLVKVAQPENTDVGVKHLYVRINIIKANYNKRA